MKVTMGETRSREQGRVARGGAQDCTGGTAHDGIVRGGIAHSGMREVMRRARGGAIAASGCWRMMARRSLAGMLSLACMLALAFGLSFGAAPSRAFAAPERVVLSQGHADFGPTLVDNTWVIQIRDDTGAQPVWRNLSDVVLQVNDHAIVKMPDDPHYAFLGAKPGTPLYVIPQTQNPQVIWLGWNTQEAGVVSQLVNGASLSLEKMTGPGAVHAYLENGNGQEPMQLWDTTQALPQQTWIESNAHTHVNWVFGAPGVYHATITFAGTLRDGREVRSTKTLNFSVGDGDPQAAFPPAGDNADAQDGQQDEQGAQDGESEQAGEAAPGAAALGTGGNNGSDAAAGAKRGANAPALAGQSGGAARHDAADARHRGANILTIVAMVLIAVAAVGIGAGIIIWLVKRSKTGSARQQALAAMGMPQANAPVTAAPAQAASPLAAPAVAAMPSPVPHAVAAPVAAPAPTQGVEDTMPMEAIS